MAEDSNESRRPNAVYSFSIKKGNMSRNLFIDVAKGLAIILVVLDHVAATARPDVYYAEYLQIPLSIFSLNDLLMPFFFMISAVFLRRRLENESHSNSSIFKNMLATRLKPYYTLSLLFFIINVSAPESMNLPSARDMIKGITIMQSNPPITPSHTLWFLFVMFVFSFCTFIFIRLLKGNMYVLFALTLLIKMYAITFVGNYYFAVDKFSTFYIYFMYGYLLSYQIFSASLFTRNIYIACLFFAWTLLTLLSQSTFMNVNVSYFIYLLGIRGLVGSLFLTGFCYKINELLSSTRIIKFVRFCGDRSLLIYVFHAPTIFLLTKLFDISASGSIAELIFIALTGTLLPLAYGKVLSYFAPIHKLLLGQNP